MLDDMSLDGYGKSGNKEQFIYFSIKSNNWLCVFKCPLNNTGREGQRKGEAETVTETQTEMRMGKNGWRQVYGN